jgi:hypothetical protein
MKKLIQQLGNIEKYYKLDFLAKNKTEKEQEEVGELIGLDIGKWLLKNCTSYIKIKVKFFTPNFQKTIISKDSILKLMSTEVCNEIDKIINVKKKIINLENDLNSIIMPIVLKYKKELVFIYGNDILNESKIEKIIEDIATELNECCPTFLKLISKFYYENDTKTTEGTFIKLVTNEFSFIEIKKVNGKTEKLYWLEYFEGSDLLINLSEKYINKKAIIKYIDKAIYKASIKGYINLKIITQLTIK